MRLLLFGPLDRVLVPAPPADRISWLGAFTYAHRGLWGDGVPENSLAAFDRAAEHGLGIELDARLSRDQRAVVFHDHTLDRLTGERGLVSRRSAAELGRLVLGCAAVHLASPLPPGGREASRAGPAEHIPTLRQVLDVVGGRVPILIELKCEDRAEVPVLCAAVQRDIADYPGRHAVMSFEPRISRWFARHAPGTLRGLSFRASRRDGLTAVIRRRLAFWRARPHFLTCDIAGLPLRLAAHQRMRGLPLVAWTVTSAEQRLAAEAHADAIIAEGSGLA